MTAVLISISTSAEPLSLRTVRQELAGGYLAVLDIEGMPLIGQWYVTHLAGKTLSPAARAFKGFLIEQGGALMDSRL